MNKGLFYRLGILIYRFRWLIVSLWLLAVLACLPFLSDIMSPFKTTGFIDAHSTSAKADKELIKTFGYDSNNNLLIMYHSDKLRADHSLFNKKIKYSLEKLSALSLKHDIYYPNANAKQISKDKHTAYAVVIFKTAKPLEQAVLTQFKSLIRKPANMTMKIGGQPIFVDDLNHQTQTDLFNADFIAAPASIIMLLLVFGSVVSALIPIVLGGSCAILILTSLYIMGHFFTLSIFTINIALLLGLCLSLDYCLFLISRFRSEMQTAKSCVQALAIAQETAGKALFFSAVAVFVSLSALLLFPVNILFSVGVGGLAAVFFALLISVIVLPAFLAILGKNINLLSIPFFSKKKEKPSPFWTWIAEHVIKRPFLYCVTILTLLLFIASPLLSAKFGVSDFKVFPKHSQSKEFMDNYAHQFDENELNPIFILFKTYPNTLFTKQNLSNLINLTKKLDHNPLISEVNSIVSLKPALNKTQYYALYSKQSRSKNPIKKALKNTTRDHLTLINVTSKYEENSPQMKHLISDLKAIHPDKGSSLTLTGIPLNNQEVLKSIKRILPYALAWIFFFTYLTLLVLLRSLVLPLKAILMNIISLAASYGVLVYVFQEGHFHQWLHFEPQGVLDISLLLIIFCALFGFSMDYEVFLLSRIKESFDRCHQYNKSIVYGIVNSSRIITSAALIVIVICTSFLVADVMMVKAFGLGIAVAIFVDAFLIRIVLVPVIMSLLKSWNWYLPRWLDRILPKL